MAFDGIVLNSVISELQPLVGAKLDHIAEPNQNNIILSVYKDHNYAINIDTTASNYAMYLTTHKKQNPKTAYNFCMVLRKHLSSARIKSIHMIGLERIAYIDFECYDSLGDLTTKTLAIELMGKYSNIILLKDDYTIIDALKKYKNANVDDSIDNARNIFPGASYFVPNNNKLNFNKTSINDFINNGLKSDFQTLDSYIPNSYVGISKQFVQCAISFLGISNTLSNDNLKEIYNYINKIINNSFDIEEFKNNYSIVLDDRDLENELLKQRLSEDFDTNILDTFKVNFFLDDFYSSRLEKESFDLYKNNLLKVLSTNLDKLVRKMDNINKKIESCSDMDKFKTYGELLTANLYRLKDLKPNDTSIELENYYDNNNLVTIDIDPTIDANLNAQKYFKKYNKLKNTLNITSIQKEETSKELNYLESLVYSLDNCSTISDLDEIYQEISENLIFNDYNFNKKGKFKKSKTDGSTINNYMKFKIDDYDVFVGKNNIQNDYLTTKLANKNDMWFHVKDLQGSHVILRCNGETPKLETIRECSKLAAKYSKAKFSSHVPVDYCLVKYVKKPNGAQPGYVIYTTNKTEYVDP